MVTKINLMITKNNSDLNSSPDQVMRYITFFDSKTSLTT